VVTNRQTDTTDCISFASNAISIIMRILFVAIKRSRKRRSDVDDRLY